MQLGRTPRRARRRRAVAGIAAVTTLGAIALAGCGSNGSGGSSGGGNADSGTLKIITWVNPPAVSALTAIDNEVMKKYPKIKVQLQTAVNVATGYANLLQTSVNSSSADIVTTVDQLQPLPLNPTRKSETPTQFWSTNSVFADLSGQPWAKNLNDTAVKAETYNGKLYGLLSGVYQELVFYNSGGHRKVRAAPPATQLHVLNRRPAVDCWPSGLGVPPVTFFGSACATERGGRLGVSGGSRAPEALRQVRTGWSSGPWSWETGSRCARG